MLWRSPSLRSVVVGLVCGAAGSIAPLELWVLAAPMAFLAILVWIASEASRRRFPVGVISGGAVAVATMTLAWAAPLKVMDRRVVGLLSSEHLVLGELAEELRGEPLLGDLAEQVPDGAARSMVRLPSRSPTYRQVRDAIERDTDVLFDLGYCGNGSTLLWGAAPIGGFRLVEARAGDEY